jgi:type IV pilus assembly protein PilC
MGDKLLRATRVKSLVGRSTGIRRSDVVAFAYKFGGMISAGLPIVQALDTLAQQSKSRPLRRILEDVSRTVTRGSSLSDAFEKHRRVFSDFFVGMVEAGESGGALGDTLVSCASYMERRADFHRKVRSAFAYPLVVGVVSLAVVTALVIFVVPVFAALYRQMRVPLPGPTRVLVGLSTLAIDWWWAMFAGTAGAAVLLIILLRDPNARNRLSRLISRVPFYSGLGRMIVVCHFVRTFVMLISAGASLIRAMEIADKVAGDRTLSEAVSQLKQSVRAGGAVSDAMSRHKIFPPEIVEMAASGENVGALSEMLSKGADFLDKDIEFAMKSALTKIEPAVTVIMGTVVGLILLSVYLPMFDYMSHIK